MSDEIPNTAKLMKGKQCEGCGWPIVFACCNEPFTNFMDASEWDWWQYCSNKGCENHTGEGVFQRNSEFVISLSEEV